MKHLQVLHTIFSGGRWPDALSARLITLAAIWAAALVGGAAAGLDNPHPEGALFLSATPAMGVSLSVQTIASNQPPLRVQLSTNLQDWLDWQWATQSTAHYLVTEAGLTQGSPGFFRIKPMGIGLTNWKLTLPVNTSHAGVPDEIMQPELASFEDSRNFHTNRTGRGLVFRASCGGVTTTGSSFPRTELREMTDHGQSLASWSPASGTHTMEIVQSIRHLPVVKPEVVAGQIHDATADVIMFKLQAHKLFVVQNEVPGPILTEHYSLGELMVVKCIARQGGVEYYFNGRYINTVKVNATNCYFKAGCYVQSNTSLGDAPTAYGEVLIYSLTVTHEP